MEHMPIQWLMEVPIVTRMLTIGVVAVSLVNFAGFASERDLVYTYEDVFIRGQFWRILTSLLYFGPFSFNVLVILYMFVGYSKYLENSFHRTKDFITCLAILSSGFFVFSTYVHPLYRIGEHLMDTMLYIYSRRNPTDGLQILGIFRFNAIYLPVMFTVPSVLRYHPMQGNMRTLPLTWFYENVFSFLWGHIYLFLCDTAPKLHRPAVAGARV
ncbi:hypothetical protein KL911_004148 [Ogataea haglerorum]|uniref:uncharacterized protein n=1 Tax=Ogataea haglerorum TaxID=1937702 RepID=UPI001C898319|nr:uncharacterized protein KL911_004148 [Ogataea haglerorum]KAG7751902.1 hypothetical protein KL911_004148 [Ogataea haglerorum]